MFSTKILIADDQPRIRSALKLLLEQDAPTRVVGEVSDASELIAQAAALQPDIVLIDWELPGLEPAGIVSDLRAACPAIVIVALSVKPEARSLALAAGADGFASKSEPPERLLAVVTGLI